MAGDPGQEGGAPKAPLDGARARGYPGVRYGEEAGAVRPGRRKVSPEVSPIIFGNEDHQYRRFRRPSPAHPF